MTSPVLRITRSGGSSSVAFRGLSEPSSGVGSTCCARICAPPTTSSNTTARIITRGQSSRAICGTGRAKEYLYRESKFSRYYTGRPGSLLPSLCCVASAKALTVKELCLYLASGSPRRLELLRQIGFAPRILRHTVDEVPLASETPREYVRRLAKAKGRCAASGLDEDAAVGLVLAADTVVTIDGSILGKPTDEADAARMLRSLRGASHQVLTAIHLQRTDDDRATLVVDSTRVVFHDYDDETVQAYVTTGEPLDKAGAYGIQGRGAFLAERIEGSWSNVVGLPLERLPDSLARIGLDPDALFSGRLISR